MFSGIYRVRGHWSNFGEKGGKCVKYEGSFEFIANLEDCRGPVRNCPRVAEKCATWSDQTLRFDDRRGLLRQPQFPSKRTPNAKPRPIILNAAVLLKEKKN